MTVSDDNHFAVTPAIDRFLKVDEVQKSIGVSRTSIYRFMARHDFPRSLKIGPNTVRWRESDVDAWIDARSRTS